MAEMIKVRKKDMEQVRKSLIDSIKFIEEIEFEQGIEKGRKQVREGKIISLENYEKKN